MNLIIKRFAKHYIKNYLVIIMVMVCAITMIYIPSLYESSLKYGESEYMKKLTHDCDVMLTGDTETISSVLSQLDDRECISYTSDSNNVYVKINDTLRKEYISLEISYNVNISGESIDVNLFTEKHTIDPKLSLTLFSVQIFFTLFGIFAVAVAFRLFNENRRSDLNSLIKLGITKSDLRNLFTCELFSLMAIAVIISVIMCDIIMKCTLNNFYSFSEVFAHIVYHKDIRTYADIISSAAVIVITAQILVMKDIMRAQSEYIYRFRSYADTEQSRDTSLTKIFAFRDARYSVPIIVFSSLTVFVSISVVCMTGLLYTEYDGADIIISANPPAAYVNPECTEVVFSQIDKNLKNCMIENDMSYTGFITKTDRFSRYGTYEIIDNKEAVLVKIIPADNSIDFMCAYTASEYDMSLFNSSSIGLMSISDNNSVEMILNGTYDVSDEENVLTIYVSEKTFEAVCGFAPVLSAKTLKFSTEEEYLSAREYLRSILTSDFRMTDIRKNINEQNSNAAAIEVLLMFMSTMFTFGASVIILAFSLTEKAANEKSNNILLKLGCLPETLRMMHIGAATVRYMLSLVIGLIPSAVVMVVCIVGFSFHVEPFSVINSAFVMMMLFICSSCMYYICKEND